MALGNDENGFESGFVTVRKNELLDKLRANRKEHEKEYLEAREGYKIAVMKDLESTLAHFKQHGSMTGLVRANWPEPADHRKDYDRVIAMLEMSTAEEVTVSESQFSQYVMDEWSWSTSTKMSAQNYAGIARAGR